MMNLHNEIMNIPVTVTMSEIGLKGDMLTYKEGYRDARHAAAELALQAEARIEGLQGQVNDLRIALDWLLTQTGNLIASKPAVCLDETLSYCVKVLEETK